VHQEKLATRSSAANRSAETGFAADATCIIRSSTARRVVTSRNECLRAFPCGGAARRTRRGGLDAIARRAPLPSSWVSSGPGSVGGAIPYSRLRIGWGSAAGPVTSPCEVHMHPHGRHGSKLRTVRMIRCLKCSLSFSSKIGDLNGISYGPGVP